MKSVPLALRLSLEECRWRKMPWDDDDETDFKDNFCIVSFVKFQCENYCVLNPIFSPFSGEILEIKGRANNIPRQFAKGNLPEGFLCNRSNVTKGIFHNVTLRFQTKSSKTASKRCTFSTSAQP
ncbi:hypothetical protein CEXT_260351 [Caerostris extrusa]|uniref:Uncharacterized protein n=1 Tax=Caerostris extrusa TaxID=172846 RepID=A0AAV4VNP7_CAEEX|nr:hypothetical protein CEXT_260351 [Caerostris extrusa]